jgi:hypothetical protein
MPRARYVSQANYNHDMNHANRAVSAANRTEGGSSQLNNFMNTGAAQNAVEHFGNTQNETNNYHTQLGDERVMAQVGFERGLQDRAMSDREAQTANAERDSVRKYGSMDVMSNSLGRMGGGGLLSGLTTSAPQAPAVNLYGSNGRRIGGTPLDGLA